MIDIPKDVQAEEHDFIYPEEPVKLPGENPLDKEIDKKSLGDAADLIANAKRPVILAGHGILLSGASKEVIELSEKGDIPLSWTLLGSGAVPASHNLNMGMMLSLIHISEPTRRRGISYAVFCLKKKIEIQNTICGFLPQTKSH